MTLDDYQRCRAQRETNRTDPRLNCARCRRPAIGCYCALIRPVHSQIQFIILIHRNEARRGIATGRLAHLCLPDSVFIEDRGDFTENERLNTVLADPGLFPVLLYPGPAARDLSAVPQPERQALFPADRRLAVVILDATWAQARRMKRVSRNLHALPQVCFTPTTPSRFLVRRQPAPCCYSTVEAIHHVIELLSPAHDRTHDNLLEVFRFMVDQQLEFQDRLHVPRRKVGALGQARKARGLRRVRVVVK